MCSRISRDSKGRPATVEDVDDEDRPLDGTKRSALAGAAPSRNFKHDIHSDSGYSSRTANTKHTMASPDATRAFRPAGIEPLGPILGAAPTPPPAPVSRKVRSSRTPSGAATQERPLVNDNSASKQEMMPQQPPQPCCDPSCVLPHFHPHSLAPFHNQFHHLPALRQSAAPPEVPLETLFQPASRPHRSVRPMSYHEDASRELDHMYARLGHGSAPQVADFPSEPYTTNSRTRIWRAATEVPRTAHTDYYDSYRAQPARVLHYDPANLPTRRPSRHGHSSVDLERRLGGDDWDMDRPAGWHRSSGAHLPKGLERRLTIDDEDPKHSFRGEPLYRHGVFNHSRQASHDSQCTMPGGGIGHEKRFDVSLDRDYQTSRSLDHDMTYANLSNPRRRPVEVCYPEVIPGQAHGRLTRHHGNSAGQRLADADRYINRVCDDPEEDELAIALRQAYLASSDSRPALRRLTERHQRSHDGGYELPHSSRRDSAYRVNVQVVSDDGTAVQSFNMRADEPVTFTVDDAGVRHMISSRPEPKDSKSPMYSWPAGVRRGVASDDREVRWPDRTKVRIRSPTREDRWERR